MDDMSVRSTFAPAGPRRDAVGKHERCLLPKMTVSLLALSLCLLCLSSCARKGRITVLTPMTSGENETRRTVETEVSETTVPPDGEACRDWIWNSDSGKLHASPSCAHVRAMNEANRKTISGSAVELFSRGLTPCMRCAAAYAVYLPAGDESETDS